MTRAELLTAVRAYSHRTDIGPESTIIELVEAMLAQRVRSRELVTYADIDTGLTPAVTAGAWALPEDYVELRDAFINAEGRRRSLTGASRAQINAYSRSSGWTSFFNIQDGLIEFQPAPAGEVVTLIYYAKPAALVDDTDTNALLTAAPSLYLYGYLVELWTIAQDDEQLAIAQDKLRREIQNVNDLAWMAQYNKGARGYSGANYSGRGARL